MTAQLAPLEAADWALSRGIVGVLVLVVLALGYVAARLYAQGTRSQAEWQAEVARLRDAWRQEVAALRDAHAQERARLAEEYRAKVEQLLREQVQMAEESTRALAAATAAMEALRERRA